MLFVEIANAKGITADQFIKNFASEIINPIILFLMALALLMFLWGMAEYIRQSDSSDARDKGRHHMLWGIIGLFIMISAYTILGILVKSIYG